MFAARPAGGGTGRAGVLPFAFCAVAAAPLLAAGWAVGARYFYLPAVGLAWAVAEALAPPAPAAQVTLAEPVVLLLGGVQAAQRRAGRGLLRSPRGRRAPRGRGRRARQGTASSTS